MMNQSATVLTINQTRAAEQAAVDAGSSFWQLMETAGTAAAQDLLKRPVKENINLFDFMGNSVLRL